VEGDRNRAWPEMKKPTRQKEPTLATAIHQKLMEDIIAARISPGMRLDENELADRYNVSRTPIREALRLLAASGVVELRPRRGIVIAGISPNTFRQILEVVADMEASAARYAAERMTREDRHRLRAVHDQLGVIVQREDAVAFDEQNQVLHRLIREGAGNAILLEAIEKMRIRTLPYTRVQFMRNRSRMAVSHSQHEVFVEAIIRELPELAYQTMRFHVINAGQAREDLRLKAQGQAHRILPAAE
jgi:DNA-binding GntR family transcriptional regulator